MKVRMLAQEIEIPDEWAEVAIAQEGQVVSFTVRRDDQSGLRYTFEVPVRLEAASSSRSETP